MSRGNKKKDETTEFLDNLVNFLTEEPARKEETAEDLREEGIDPDEALNHFRQILTEHAPTWRERAARERKAAQETLSGLKANVRTERKEVEEEIRRTIESLMSLGAQLVPGTYYRQFKEATIEDLESLLQDLSIQKELLLKKNRESSEGNK